METQEALPEKDRIEEQLEKTEERIFQLIDIIQKDEKSIPLTIGLILGIVSFIGFFSGPSNPKALLLVAWMYMLYTIKLGLGVYLVALLSFVGFHWTHRRQLVEAKGTAKHLRSVLDSFEKAH